jgi:hypothetical protein
MSNPIKWWLNWKPPKGSDWVAYAIIIVAIITLAVVVAVYRIGP